MVGVVDTPLLSTPFLLSLPENATTATSPATSRPPTTSSPVLAPKGKEDAFHGADLQRVFSTQDRFGYPAVGFEIRLGFE